MLVYLPLHISICFNLLKVSLCKDKYVKIGLIYSFFKEKENKNTENALSIHEPLCLKAQDAMLAVMSKLYPGQYLPLKIKPPADPLGIILDVAGVPLCFKFC